MSGVIGRPTAYQDHTPGMVQEYLETYEEMEQKIPTVQGLAIFLDVSTKTIYEWLKDEEKVEFRNILARLMDTQAQVLINKGISGDFNSTITKLILTKHGYHDKVDNTLAAPDGGPVQSQYVITPVAPKQIEQGEEDVEDV